MNKTRKMVGALALGAVVTSTFAANDTAYWTNTVYNAEGYNWFQKPAVNWTNETGALEYAPATGEDIVLAALPSIPQGGFGGVIAEQSIWAGQTIYTPASDSGNYDTQAARLAAMTNATVGKITGEFNRTLIIDNRSGVGDYDIKNVDKIPAPDDGTGRYIEVSDPNDFYGIWNPMGVYTRLIVNQKDTSKEAVIHNLKVANMPVLSVMKGSSAKVEVMTGGGAIRKVGSGKVTFGQADAAQTKIVMEGSDEIEFTGHAPDELEKLLAQSAIHLDATKDSFETTTDSSGNILVGKWKDAEGREDLYAFANTNRSRVSHEAVARAPYYVANATAGGLPLVDFSAWKNPGAGHSAQILELSQRFDNVRAVFYVADCPRGADNCWMIGDKPPSGGSSLQFSPGSSVTLYDASYSDPCVRHGDIFVNGVPTTFNSNNALGALHTVAQSTLSNACVKLLGSREYYGSSSGGGRFGEFILFTNELTRAERIYISNYLNSKWGTRADQNGGCDFSELFISDSSAGAITINVPEGRVAKIGTLRAKSYGSSYGIIKTGGGTLELDEVYPADAKITVNDGKVVFKKAMVTTDAPADGAYVWLDATKWQETMTINEQNGTNYVTQWNDRNGNATYAKTAFTDGMHMPRLVDSPILGAKVLDFGVVNGDATVRNNTSAAMQFSNWNSGSNKPTYHYFAVMRMKTVQNASIPIVAGDDMATYRDSSLFFANSYRTAKSLGSSVRINGAVIDPTKTPACLYNNEPTTTNQFYVVSVSTALPFAMNGLCSQRSGCQRTCGGMEFAEVLTYRKALTPDERRQTEAYLMKKWLGKAHPSQEETPLLTFAATEDVALDSDLDMALSSVAGGNGNIVKTGSGLITISTLGVSPKNVTIEAGGLQIPAGASTFLDDALFHFDASRLDSMDYTVVDGVTNVTSWADVTGNGVSAVADSDALATQNPRLSTIETSQGSGRFITAMDFGQYSWRTNDLYQANGSASMTIKKGGSLYKNNIQEGFVVFADAKKDADTYDHRASTFCSVGSHPAQRDWVEGKLGVWRYEVASGVYCSAIGAGSSQFLNATAGTLDGVVQTSGPNGVIPTAGVLHVYDYVNSNNGRNPVSGWAGFEVSALARNDGSVKANASGWPYDYDFEWNDRGGILIAEQMCFTRYLTEAEATYVKALINYKWFGGEHPGYLVTNVLDSVFVAKDASLAITKRDEICSAVKALGGEGTISTTVLELQDSFDVTVGNGKTSHLTVVNGAVAFDGALTVNVAVDLTAGRVKAGRYPILTAPEFVGFEDTTFTINIEQEETGIYADLARIVKDGDTLYLEVVKRGLMLFVK